ncbi:MAG TPA: hypothetical protein VLE49_01015, partial [Anaerolineales bacterium]|nr:hypothetical protein [Anaerolineales bacterium]
QLTAEDVARAVVNLAKRPRRSLVLPWVMNFSIFLNSHFTGLSDSLQARALARYHEEAIKKSL